MNKIGIDNSKQIKYGSVISYALIIINIILGLVYTPWILKTVGSSDYGLYTLASSLISLFLLDFGMSAAVTRFISNYRAQNNQEEIDAFVSLALRFYIAICCGLTVVLAGVFINIEKIYSNLTTSEISNFKIVFLITAFFVIICFPVNICNGILNAYEQYIWLKGSDVLNKLGTVLATIIALLLHGGIISLVFINGFFNFITLIVKCAIVAKKTPVHVSSSSRGKIGFKEIFSFSAWTTVNSLSQQMVFNLIPSILEMVLNTFAITLYGFANVIEGYVFNITQAINGLFMPQVSRIVVNDKDARKVLPLMIKVGRINQSVISLLIIGLTVLGKEFVHLWVGDEYSLLYYCILFLTIPYFISASQQIAGTSIIVLNKVKYSAIICLSTGIANLIISYFIAKQFGVVGVCATIGTIFIIRTVAMNLVYHFVLKIEIIKFFKSCHIVMFPGIIISAVMSYFTIALFPLSADGFKGWIFFGLKAAIVSLIYCCVMWLIGWNENEKHLIRSIIPKFRDNRS